MTYNNGQMKLELIMIIREKALFKRLNDDSLIVAYKPVFDESNGSVYWGQGKYHLTKDRALEILSNEFKEHMKEVVDGL